MTASFNLSSMTVGEIISRSWRLYRLNIKDVILFTLIPSVIYTVAQVFLNLPSAFLSDPSAASNPVVMGSTCCFFYPAGFLLLFGGMFVAIFFNGCLIKAFYNKLTGKVVRFKEIINYINQFMPRFLKLCGLLALEIFVFTFLDVILLIACYMAFLVPMMLGIAAGREEPVIAGIGVVAGIVLFMIALIIMTMIVMMQFFLCTLQIVIVVLEDTPVLKTIPKSIDLISRNLWRSTGFMFAIVMLWYVLAFYFNLPASIFMMVMMFKEGIAGSAQPPVFIIILVTTWSYMVSMFIWPFLVSGITMFYYDMRVRSEGLDLKLSVEHLKSRAVLN
jgi:hypothetical protein